MKAFKSVAQKAHILKQGAAGMPVAPFAARRVSDGRPQETGSGNATGCYRRICVG